VITINRHKHIAALGLHDHASAIIDIVDQIDVVPEHTYIDNAWPHLWLLTATEAQIEVAPEPDLIDAARESTSINVDETEAVPDLNMTRLMQFSSKVSLTITLKPCPRFPRKPQTWHKKLKTEKQIKYIYSLS
jgi:hypothetical protein